MTSLLGDRPMTFLAAVLLASSRSAVAFYSELPKRAVFTSFGRPPDRKPPRSVAAVAPQPVLCSRGASPFRPAVSMSSRRREEDEDDDEDDGRRFEYARVGRRRGRGYRDEAEYDDDRDYADDRRRGRVGDPGDYDDEEDELGVDGTYAEDDDDYDEYLDYDDDDEDEDYEEGILVPNPLLDRIDPEGAADRLEELFGDPKWWRDVALIGLVCLVVYVSTYDIDELVPWDVVTVDDFDLKSMYGPQ